MQIRTLERRRFSEWNEFVTNSAHGSFFHRAEWSDVLEQGAGFESHYLYAERDGAITGVLPLGLTRSRLFRHALVSNPFCVSAGTMADDRETAKALEDAAVDLAEELRVHHLELRSTQRTRPEWPAKEIYYNFERELSVDAEENFKSIPKKERAEVRRAARFGLESRVEPNVDRFYHIYATSVRNLGSPVYSRRYFRRLVAVFGDRCDVQIVSHRGVDIAGVLSFYDRDRVLPYYGGGMRQARDLRAFPFMYWELMRRACRRGVRRFDFGRSIAGTGSYHFKKNWGFRPEPLFYQYHLVRGRNLPDRDPSSPSNRLLMSAWRKLPLAVANRLGPRLARQLT